MAFTPENYLMAEDALDQIAAGATQHLRLLDEAIIRMQNAVTRLQAMQGDWSPAVTFIDDQVVANPADAEWLSLQARKDKMVTNFVNMRDLAIAVKDAAVTARG